MRRITFNRKGSKFTGDKDGGLYNRAHGGHSLSVLFSRTVSVASDVDSKNIIARGQNFNYSENYQIWPVFEWDTNFIQETVIGMQDMGSFDVQIMYTLRNNDSLPTVRTLPYESEMQIFQSKGQDQPEYGMVFNSWIGARFVGRGSGMSPNGIVMDSVRGIYRYRLTGKDFKLLNPATKYPGGVEEVDLVDTGVGIN